MVDLSFLETFTKGNKEKMKRYINIYLSIAPGIFENMTQNIIDQDWEQLRINAHSLKPQADYMGILGLKSVLVEIEKNVYENHFDQLSKLLEKASNIHINSTPYLSAFVDSP